MTIPKEILELAIEGGWHENEEWHFQAQRPVGDYWFTAFDSEDVQDFTLCAEQILLDTRFWRSLGKALGWDDGKFHRFGYADSPYSWMWQFIAHQLYHLILTEASQEQITAFWQELLDNKNV